MNFIKHGIEMWSVNEGEQRMDNHLDKFMNYIRFGKPTVKVRKCQLVLKLALTR